MLAVNTGGTLLVSGDIEGWAEVLARGADTVVDLDGYVDEGLPEIPNRMPYVYFAAHVRALPCRVARADE